MFFRISRTLLDENHVSYNLEEQNTLLCRPVQYVCYNIHICVSLPPRFTRMSPNRFDHILSLVEPLSQKENTRFREAISAAERLSLTLRYLASGESQQALSFSYRIGKSTVSEIIREIFGAIYSALAPTYLKP